ncbi:MAG: hypothetical protein WD334_05845 [Chitinophagales bacterium]
MSIAFLALFQIQDANAQNTERFQGKYTLQSGIEGQVDFQFFIADDDTVKQGDFQFQSNPQLQENDSLRESKRISGQYSKGMKNGQWTYSSKLLKTDAQSTFDGYNVVYKTNGTEYFVSGQFKEGKAEGKWQFLLQKIIDSQPADTLFFAQTNFKAGAISGNFNAFNDSMRIIGQIDDKGLVDGAWTFSHSNDLAEHRVYEHGVFTKHYFILDKDTLPMEHVGLDTSLGNSNEKWEELQVSATYFQIIYHTNFGVKNSDSKVLESEKALTYIENANGFLKDALFAFSDHGDLKIWEMLSGSEALQNARLKIRKFPFSAKEKSTLKELAHLLESTRDMLDSYFEDAQIDVSKNSYEEIAFYFEIMRIYAAQIDKIHPFVMQISRPEFEYINRDEILSELAPEIKYPDEVSYLFKNKSISKNHDFPKGLIKENNTPSALVGHLKSIRKDLVEIDKETAKILGKYKKESLLSEKEQYLVEKKDSLLDLYGKTETDESFNIYHKLIAGKVKAYVQKEFETYASLKLEKKIDTISDITDCFSQMISSYFSIEQFPSKLEALDEAYARVVWNPYTYTDMEERMKERLYKAFENNLFPYFLEELTASINCAEINEKIEFFDLLHDRMLELREQDTKTIERQLRRTGSIEEIMQILSIKNRND